LFDRRIDGKASVFNEIREEENRFYQRNTYGVSLGIERSLTTHLFGSLVYDFQLNHFTQFAETVSLITADQERANLASVTPSLIWDRRDDPFNPRSGTLATVALETASLLLGSQEQYWKLSAGTSIFHPIAQPVVIAIGTRGGIASLFGETRRSSGPTSAEVVIPLSERFYVGGRSSVRGYDEDTVGRYPNITNPFPPPAMVRPVTGGNIFLVANAEVRVSLPGSLGLVFFWDGGTVWQDQRDVHWSGIWNDLTFTTGGGLRYNTPVGPLRLDYGHKLDWHPGESHGTLHFTLGHAF
jgi:outer membrane protein insertion porin family